MNIHLGAENSIEVVSTRCSKSSKMLALFLYQWHVFGLLLALMLLPPVSIVSFQILALVAGQWNISLWLEAVD